MPGAWRNGMEHEVHAPFAISHWAHFVIFLCIALVMRMRPLAWSTVRVILFALSLAFLTEGMQFFAIDRHPRWRDVGIDMSGAAMALSLIYFFSFFSKRHD